MEMWEKFDKKVDTKALSSDVKEVQKNGGGDYKEVPVGTYEVEVNKLELKESKTGNPMLSIWFKILVGEFKGSLIFYNQALHTGFGLHNANEFLRSMDTEVEINFESFKQYNDMLLDISEELDGTLEFALEYGKNNKGYNTYKIVDVFEK